jgi:ATPase subunit of ABC transporter with duplicated ATPase domains
LDVQQRPLLLKLLQKFHELKTPYIILGLRPQDPLPDWVTHVAWVQDGMIVSGAKNDPTIVAYLETHSDTDIESSKQKERAVITSLPDAQTLIEVKALNVSYHDRRVSSSRSSVISSRGLLTNSRQVLQNIDWTVKEGDRWHLVGPNGKYFFLISTSLSLGIQQGKITMSLTQVSSWLFFR